MWKGQQHTGSKHSLETRRTRLKVIKEIVFGNSSLEWEGSHSSFSLPWVQSTLLLEMRLLGKFRFEELLFPCLGLYGSGTAETTPHHPAGQQPVSWRAHSVYLANTTNSRKARDPHN